MRSEMKQTERARIEVSVAEQTLVLYRDQVPPLQYSISSALNGVGQQQGSGCTPLGRHRVRARIGAGQVCGAVFVGRRPTGEVWTPKLAQQFPQRDWILSRILWLCGEERGYNRLGDVDSMQRFIYIHGTPDTEPMGVARSHGCIRMRNTDIIELFGLVPVGCPVLIRE
jgi:lipoprotein-anchoring transpeptidase ErfK/SrfK